MTWRSLIAELTVRDPIIMRGLISDPESKYSVVISRDYISPRVISDIPAKSPTSGVNASVGEIGAVVT